MVIKANPAEDPGTTLRPGEKARLVIDVSMTEKGVAGTIKREGYSLDLATLVARAQYNLDKVRAYLFSMDKTTSNNKQNKQKKGD